MIQKLRKGILVNVGSPEKIYKADERKWTLRNKQNCGITSLI